MSKDKSASEIITQLPNEQTLFADNIHLVGEKIIPFGERYINYMSLLRNRLTLHGKSGKYSSKYLTSKPISHELKNILLDIIFKNKFAPNEYDKLDDNEKLLFDRAIGYARLSTHQIGRHLLHSEKQKRDMLKTFEILRGEVLAGNNSIELLKKMRSLLFELRRRDYIAKADYDKLIVEIANCI